jgi:hypothetical protein
MPHSFRSLLVASTLGVFVGFALCGDAAQPAKPTTKDDPNAARDAAVAAITRLGGQVTFDTTSPDRSATGVRLFGPTITDAPGASQGADEPPDAIPHRDQSHGRGLVI